MKVALVVATLLLNARCFAGPIVYDPSLYTFLAVTSQGTQAGINNLGEIVYQKITLSARERIYSTLRGDITPDATRWNARQPSINDSGEVVFYGTHKTDSWSLYSISRGRLDSGGWPGINSFGEVAYSITQNPPNCVKSSSRGTLLNFTNAWSNLRVAINDSGEVVYDLLDTNSVVQLYSATRGQLTTNGGYHPAINKYGDILYLRKVNDFDGFAVYVLGGPRLTSFNIRKDVKVKWEVNLNDHGDFVFSVASTNAHQVVLATQRPQFYPQYSRFDPLNLISGPRITLTNGSPGTLTLSGLVGMNYRVDYTPTYNPTGTNAWQTLTNINLPTSPYTIADPTASASSQRFYRAVWLRDPDLI